jgi:hypothetical protein
MAVFLAGGDAYSALRAECITLFRMQQKAAASAAITLAILILTLAMRTLRHGQPPEQQIDIAGLLK